MIETPENTADKGIRGLLTAPLLLLILLAGCGQSGPLFLPEQAQPADAESEQAAPPAEEDDEETSGA
jgi:predicted small lipoprotein YifL